VRNRAEVTLHILFRSEIYAREMLPFLTFWKASLRREDDLIRIESLYDSLSMIHIELCEEVIEEQDDRDIEIFPEHQDLELLKSEEEHLILATREIGAHIVHILSLLHDEGEIIEMRPHMRMSGEDIAFPIFSEIIPYVFFTIFFMEISTLVDALDRIMLEKW
jgi:hypothetical protein